MTTVPCSLLPYRDQADDKMLVGNMAFFRFEDVRLFKMDVFYDQKLRILNF